MEPRTILKVVITVVIVGLLLPLFAGFSFGGSATLTPEQGTQDISDQIVGQPQDLSVSATKGNALAFDDGDYVAVDSQNFSQGSWSVCSAARLNSDASRDGTYNVFAWNNGSLLLQYDAGQWAAFYENETGAEARATIDATSPSDGFTPVCARYNESENSLVVSEDGELSSPAQLDLTTASRNVSTTWNGTLDEVRTFDSAVNNSTIDAYAADPIVPLPGTNRSARYMFDEGEGSTTMAYFVGSSVSIDGAEWTDGVAGPGLVEGTDYKYSTSPLELTIPTGSYLIGAPVAYISWLSLPFDIPLASYITALLGALIIVYITSKFDL